MFSIFSITLRVSGYDSLICPSSAFQICRPPTWLTAPPHPELVLSTWQLCFPPTLRYGAQGIMMIRLRPFDFPLPYQRLGVASIGWTLGTRCLANALIFFGKRLLLILMHLHGRGILNAEFPRYAILAVMKDFPVSTLPFHTEYAQGPVSSLHGNVS